MSNKKDNRKMKIAVVGVANMGVTRRAQLKNSGLFDIVALYDTDIASLEQSAKEDKAVMCNSLEELLANEEIEAVSINTPIPVHAEQSIQALEAGKHVLVEKPISNSIESAEAMILAAQKANKVLMIAHNQRFDPAFGFIKEHYVDSGKLGRICAIRIVGASSAGLAQPKGAWRTIAELNPAGPLLQCGCHLIDTLMCYFGKIDISTIKAQMRNDITDGDVVDCISLIAKLENGIMLTMDEYYTSAYRHEFHIYGTQANLYYYYHRRILKFQECKFGAVETPIDVPIPDLPPNEQVTSVVTEFYNAIRENRQPNPSNTEALDVLRVVIAADSAAGQNRFDVTEKINHDICR